jgi:hypothetical protein
MRIDRPQWKSLSFHVKRPGASAEQERPPQPYASPWPLSSRTVENRSVQRTHACLLCNEKQNTKNSDSGCCYRQIFFFFSPSKKTRDMLVASDVACSKYTPGRIQHKNLIGNRGGKLRQLGDDGWGRRGRSPSRADRRRVTTPGLQV